MDIKRILLIKHDFDDSKDEYAMFQWALKYGQELIDTVITQQYEMDKIKNNPTGLLQVIKQFVGKE